MKGTLLTRLIAVLVTTLVVHLVIGLGFLWQKNSAWESQKSEIASLRAQWDEQDFERKSVQEEELKSRYGTTKLDRISFDPRMDIRLVILKLFEGVMPPEYLVTVDVDRFSEFMVYINVYNMPETGSLAGYLKEVFSRVDSRDVYQLIFTDEDNYWIIDQNKLSKIGNWENTSIKDIKKNCFRL